MISAAFRDHFTTAETLTEHPAFVFFRGFRCLNSLNYFFHQYLLLIHLVHLKLFSHYTPPWMLQILHQGELFSRLHIQPGDRTMPLCASVATAVSGFSGSPLTCCTSSQMFHSCSYVERRHEGSGFTFCEGSEWSPSEDGAPAAQRDTGAGCVRAGRM